MPAKKQGTVKVACPHCGHQQLEPPTGYSTNCKSCGQYFRVQDALRPSRKKADTGPEQRSLVCLECGTSLAAPKSAQSTMCRRCSAYLDLRDYQITNAVSKNFKTVGRFVVEPKGYIFNTESVVGEAVIKGRFLGKLVVSGTLTLHSSAEISGSFTAGNLVIPAGEHFRWTDLIKVRSATLGGELTANLQAEETVTLEPTARLFGNITAPNLIVWEGAVLVGTVRIGPLPPSRKTSPRK